MKLKKLSILFLAFIMLFSVACSNDKDANSEEIEVPENAVARVNDEFIKQETFDKNVAFIKDRYTQQYGKQIWEQPKVLNMVKNQSLEQMIRTEIIKNHIENNYDFEIDQTEVDETFNNFKTQIDKNEEMKKFYKENEITDEFLKEQIANELYLKKFNDELTKEVKENEELLNEKYENEIARVNASHILVKDEAKAKVVKEKLNAGEEFAELAKEYSKDPASVENGGDLGYFSKGEMAPEFEKKAFELNVGDISEPVKSQFGFHIIRVDDKQTVNDLIKAEADQKTIDSYKDRIVSQAVNSKYSQKIASIQEDSTIERYVEFNDDSSEDQKETEETEEN
ncbi:MAG: peptidylprolyl isomerase [Bacillota bacterium]